MRPLNNASLVLVSDPSTERDHLSVWLRSEGATVRMVDWPGVVEELAKGLPSALLLDQRAHDAEAETLVDSLRTQPAGRELAIIALASKRELASVRVDGVLEMPAHPAELVASVANLIEGRNAGRTTLTHEEMIESVLEARALISDLKGILQLLNATGPFRYTSVLRFEPDETLTSIWTFDRAQPELNAFPEGKPVRESYCGRVRDIDGPFAMQDAEHEPSVATHPARHSVLAYCGVPLQREDGSFYGTLCQFDVTPRYFQPVTVKRLVDAAQVLRKHWPVLKR
jgi:CheY-like chemotaxis protein